MKRKWTTLTDSYGVKIYEGDTVEYFDPCYAHCGLLFENEESQFPIDQIPEGLIERGHSNGYTVQHTFKKVTSGIIVLQLYKPCVGVVKWNPEYVTYEPVVNCWEDYNNNSFHYVVNRGEKNGAYCKVIKSFKET